MKRSTNIFFTRKDEQDFSIILKKKIPLIKFIDGCYWPNPEPPVCRSINECKENIIFLWNPLIADTLPSIHEYGP
jgi:hypothetical protein